MPVCGLSTRPEANDAKDLSRTKGWISNVEKSGMSFDGSGGSMFHDYSMAI